ncbi:subtilisin DY domain protein [Synechococcus sp. A15-28]|nr:subtilisin DY domain protein [Synechococcus sp. A15-28]
MPSTSSSDKVHDQVKTATKSGKNGNKSLAKKNIAFKTTYDIDDNGLVDGSEKPGYKLYTPESGILITAKSGKTFSEATSEKWSAIAAAPTEKGYRVLITNNQSKKGKYKIWKLSSKGIVRSKGRWLRERALSSEGYEEVFGIDFNGDGMIEADTLIDVGDADFSLTGNATVGKRLRAKRADDDPDGNGRPLITWQAFSGASIWTTADTGKSIRIPATLEGAQVRARVEYKDGDGFQETVFTQSRSIPYVDNGDAAFLIQGTPAVGQTLSITQSVADPDGDGTPSFSWLQSSDGINWSFLSSNPTFDIPDNLEGQTITATVRYTDNQGFEESISTNALTIPYVDNGDAAFLIQGTPAVGQTLSITQSIADPDGNGAGTSAISWLQSSDSVNWSVISTAPTFNISKDLEGKRIRAIVSYSDGQGFSESINTDDLTIPYVDDGDADFLIQGTAAVSEIISISRSADDPDGNGDGALEIAWQASLDGTNWWEISTASDHQIGSNLAGHQLNAVVQYTDSQGFKETITTDSVSVPGTAGSNSDGKDDYGGSTTTNGRLTIHNSISGELELAGDHDWFAINLTAGRRYQFDLNGVSLEDPFLYLRSSSSSLVAYNDDESLLSLDSQLNYTAESSGTHYLDVGAYQDVYAGTYTLRASELTPPDPGFNSTDGYGHVSAQRAFEQLLNISLDPVDALGGNLWGVDNVDAPEVWNGGSGFAGATGSGTTIAVIDTGVDLDHPEFLGRIVAGYDFVDDDSIADDGNGHGTHVAGTIAGANDGTGITGVAYDAAIMPLRVLGNDGYGWTSDIISAVRWAADNGAHVINLSLGVSGYSQAMADAISYASGRGSVVVMAAGNSGGMAPEYPAAHAIDHGIAVGAVDSNRSFAGFSNRAGSTQLDYVTAPGVNIYSAVPGGGYDTFNGTSMATPYVAGVAGLLKSHDGSLSASAIEDLLTGSGSNNSISDSTAWNTTSSIPWSTRDVITMQTLDSFSDKQLSGTLIASVDGNGRERRSTLRGLKQGIRSNDASYDGLEAVKTIEASRNSFAVLEISNDHAINQRALLTELLGSNQFHYLEKEQQFSIV